MDNELIHRLQENIRKVIVGKEETIQLVLTALLADGHILLEDVPGTGKTMLAKTVAKSLDAGFSRIQFTPDLLPSDVTGIHYYNQKEGAFVLRTGPVFSNIILADEINRATPRTQSSLLECMEERQVTLDGETLKLPEPFLVIATQNPVETAGTYTLPEAQLDRFLVKLSVGYPTQQEEIHMMNRFYAENPLDAIEAVCGAQDIVRMQAEVLQVYVHDSLKEYLAEIVQQTRKHPKVAIGVSPRGTLSLLRAVRAYAYMDGRGFVTPEDIQKLAVPVLAHRIILATGYMQGRNADEIINEVLEKVSVPTEEWG